MEAHRSILNYKFTSRHCANVYVLSWIDVTENRHVGRRSHLRPKDTLAEVTFPPHNAAEYIEHAQLLAMDFPNMLTADAVRNKTRQNFIFLSLICDKYNLKRISISYGNFKLKCFISLRQRLGNTKHTTRFIDTTWSENPFQILYLSIDNLITYFITPMRKPPLWHFTNNDVICLHS